MSGHDRQPSIARRTATWRSLLLSLLLSTADARAGGGPENALLIVDPGNPESLYIANHYKTARNIPDRNVIYMNPQPANYNGFVDFQLDAFLGSLTTLGIDDHIDYVIIPPGSDYRVSAQGFITDGCVAVQNFSVSSLYTMAHVTDDILAGDTSQRRNEYFAANDLAIAFDSNTPWRNGIANTTASARRYFIGAMLGYTGQRGNTLAETIDMIDRSLTADGSHPVGTFYFVQTTDPARSTPRDPFFDDAVASLASLGAIGVHLGDGVENVVLPLDEHDILGVMTGWALPDISNATMTLLPGAFADHLTSFAGDFNNPSQTKMSEWIKKGASGTCGTVEEPCNFPGKFPHPRVHVFYNQGLSLGEANFRSLGFVPYQVLMYGDPLTKPFAHIPVVDVADLPANVASDSLTFTPSATTTHPTAIISRFDLHVDGVLHSSVQPGETFVVNTNALADGFHTLRVIAVDNTTVATQGQWTSDLLVDNNGLNAAASADTSTGNLDTVFNITVAATGDDVTEIRLIHNHRVLAATSSANATFPISASSLGAGQVQLIASADFAAGGRAVSTPVTLDIAFDTLPNPNAPGPNSAPTAHSYTTFAIPGVPRLLDAPATDSDGDALTSSIITGPAQGTTTAGASTILLRPTESANGTDTITFNADDGLDSSNVATITVNYCETPIVTQSPTDAQGCEGDTIVLTVTATGADPSYQWFKNNQPIPGESSESLVIDPLADVDVGVYFVDVTTPCADASLTARSESATVGLLDPTSILVQPIGATLCIGESWFAITSAPGADTIQWLKDGIPIDGATSPFLFINSVTPDNRGTYTVEASNLCNTVVSDPAVLQVVGCGDGDGDDDVDLSDFGQFQTCFTTPVQPVVTGACNEFDFDGNEIIDLTDYTAYSNAVTGP
jgi:uncharacterized protein (TIGR03790 family)